MSFPAINQVYGPASSHGNAADPPLHDWVFMLTRFCWHHQEVPMDGASVPHLLPSPWQPRRWRSWWWMEESQQEVTFMFSWRSGSGLQTIRARLRTTGVCWTRPRLRGSMWSISAARRHGCRRMKYWAESGRRPRRRVAAASGRMNGDAAYLNT